MFQKLTQNCAKELRKKAFSTFIPLDIWHPKNRINYPKYYYVELIDQLLTEHTFLKYFSTSLEFCAIRNT